MRSISGNGIEEGNSQDELASLGNQRVMGEPRKASTSLQLYLLRYVQHSLHPTEQTVVSNGNVHAASWFLGVYSDRLTISLSESSRKPSEARRSFASCNEVISGTDDG